MRKRRHKSSGSLDAALALCIRGGAAAVGALPAGLAANAGAFAGSMIRRLVPIRRGVVRENLAIAFGSTHSPSEIRRIERATYRSFGMMAAEWLGLYRHGLPWLEKQIDSIEEHPDSGALAKSGAPFFVITGHFGNWEMLGAYFASRYPLSALAKPMHNARLNADLDAMRRRYGLEILYSTEQSIARQIFHATRAGRHVCFLGDQDARSAGQFVPFFGRPASTFRGPALFAVRMNIPLIPGYLLRLGPGRHRVLIRAPIYPNRDLPAQEAVEEMTRRHVKVLEDVIRIMPSQYFWFHRRWKTRPPRPRAAPAR